MSREEIEALIDKYDARNIVVTNQVTEHRLDPDSSRILYALVREYQPTSAIEFGTSWGGSGMAIVKAMVDNQKPFKYVGFELDPNIQKAAGDNIANISRENTAVYGDIMQNVDKLPDEIDFAFIDPDQDITITHWWLQNVLPRIKPGSLVQIHDWSVREVDGKLKYEGGSFPGIKYLIELVEDGLLPLKKLFAVWDFDDYRNKQIAASFWIKQ